MTKYFTCEQCGKIKRIKPDNRRRNANRYCSRECHNTARTKPKPSAVSACKQCGQEYVKRHGSFYCSDQCRKAYARAYTAERDKARRKPAQRTCKQCGGLFVPEYATKRRVFCGEGCANRYARRYQVRGNLNGRARRYLRKVYGAVLPIMYQYINPRKVYERDNWTCGICGGVINRESSAPDDDSPSIDHVVALASGGAHTYENVQAAHFRCNWEKGALEASVKTGALSIPVDLAGDGAGVAARTHCQVLIGGG